MERDCSRKWFPGYIPRFPSESPRLCVEVNRSFVAEVSDARHILLDLVEDMWRYGWLRHPVWFLCEHLGSSARKRLLHYVKQLTCMPFQWNFRLNSKFHV
ncbi:hypothetical protein GJ496_004275 [Pomphorhynchus laevis]|nr:hypothetical protein GJ496_004275 [Pomphorhynchus laevis]